MQQSSWHDINEPGVFRAAGNGPPKQHSTQQDQPDDSSGTEEQKTVILRNGVFAPGPEGYLFAKKASVRVEVDEEGNQGGKISGMVTFRLFSRYTGQVQDHKHEVDSGVSDGIAQGELTLYYDDAYYDAGMPADQVVEYYFTASHPRAREVLQSEVLQMPKTGGTGEITIEVELDPNDKDHQDDQFTLFGGDQYRTTLTMKDCTLVGENVVRLSFTELDESLSYSLEVDPGGEKSPYRLFEDVPFEDLKNA